MHAVIAEQMGIGFHAAEVVDGDRFDIRAPALHQRAQNQATDAAKPVDRYLDRHKIFPFGCVVSNMGLLVKPRDLV